MCSSVETVRVVPRPIADLLQIALAELLQSTESHLRVAEPAWRSLLPITTGTRDVTKAKKESQQ